MPPTVVITSESTPDAVPTAAPYKLSAQTGKNTATVNFTATAATGNIRCWQVRESSASRILGKRLAGLGAVCGVARCGLDRPLSALSPLNVAVALTFAQVNDGGADGARTLSVYAWDANSAA